MNPPITVQMCVYNIERIEKFLAKTMENILEQTFSDFEFLIIDDCSTDRTGEIIRSYTDPRIQYVRLSKNSVKIDALNIGVLMAKGKYIALIDADDEYSKDKLKIQYEYLEAHPEIDIVGCNYAIIDEYSRKTGCYSSVRETHEEIMYDLLRQDQWLGVGILIRTQCFYDYIEKMQRLPFSHDAHYAEDVEFLTSLVTELNVRCHNIPDLLFFYRHHSYHQHHHSTNTLIYIFVRLRLLKSLGFTYDDAPLLEKILLCSGAVHFEERHAPILEKHPWLKILSTEEQIHNYLKEEQIHNYLKTKSIKSVYINKVIDEVYSTLKLLLQRRSYYKYIRLRQLFLNLHLVKKIYARRLIKQMLKK